MVGRGGGGGGRVNLDYRPRVVPADAVCVAKVLFWSRNLHEPNLEHGVAASPS